MTQTISPDMKFKRGEDLDINQVPDGYVVYHDGNDRVHFLNVIATVIFELCDGNHTVGEIREILVTTYEIGDDFPDEAYQLVMANLRDEELIVPCP